MKPNHLPDCACALCALVLSVAIANAGFRGEENPPADAAGGFLGGLTVTTASTVTTSAFLSVSPSTLIPDGILEQSYDVSPQTLSKALLVGCGRPAPALATAFTLAKVLADDD